jgi:Glycoside-hydrolase family GH114
MAILPDVQNIVQFAVNEQCVEKKECSMYSEFLEEKPVFHVEYTDSNGGLSEEHMCLQDTADEKLQQMSTIMTTLDLDGRGQFCDGTTFVTKVTEPRETSGRGVDD